MSTVNPPAEPPITTRRRGSPHPRSAGGFTVLNVLASHPGLCAAGVDRYRERSPVQRADAITAPLLILQGADDDVVPPAQSQAIADRVRARGGEVELHLYAGERHGWSRPETVVDELQRTEAFLRRHVLRVAR